MDRFAVLVETSTLKGHDDLPGAKADVESYREWLKSDFGGAWEDSEILTLSKPLKSNLQRAIQLAGARDYALVTFSGHGHHVKGKGIDETRLCINDTEEISVFELYPQCPYSLIVADACRKVSYLDAVKQAKAFAMALNESERRLKPNRARCRALFDASLSKAEKGPIYFYSCSLDEAAADIPSFSSKLVEVGQGWADNYKDYAGLLPTNLAFQGAAAEITRRNRQQNPQVVPGRRNAHFPWGVMAC
jgi:hypothetical protein